MSRVEDLCDSVESVVSLMKRGVYSTSLLAPKLAELATELAADLRRAVTVMNAVRRWSASVEEGFASEERPDICRARIVKALREFDEQDEG